MDEYETVPVRGADGGRYRSYLVRLWREAPGAPWRCQVHCVGSGEERRFPGLAELFEYLAADATAEAASPGAQVPGTLEVPGT